MTDDSHQASSQVSSEAPSQASAPPPLKKAFQSDTSRLLELVTHALYSDREVFLRELISNASDACDRRRLAQLTGASTDPLEISVKIDKKAKKLILQDDGIGMDAQELEHQLGTVAHSGTLAFLEQHTPGAASSSSGAASSSSGASGVAGRQALLGQFGVGFYASFMVADYVRVLSRKLGDTTDTTKPYVWHSDGRTGFMVEPAEGLEAEHPIGTSVELLLNGDSLDFLEVSTLERIIRKWSNHIAFPVFILDGLDKKRVNADVVPWTRPFSELDETEKKQVYQNLVHDFDTPWRATGFHVEGTLEWYAMLFIPGRPSLEWAQPDREARLKLYVRHVLVTDAPRGALPPFLRFVCGVVDSLDLPMTMSREMLKDNAIYRKMMRQLKGRILRWLEAESKKDGYALFWRNFGAILKEGLYASPDEGDREQVLGLARFKSLLQDGLIDLETYLEASQSGTARPNLADSVDSTDSVDSAATSPPDSLPDSQESAPIYYVLGDSEELLSRNPHMEIFRKKNIDVLFLTDPIDAFWVTGTPPYKGRRFVSAPEAPFVQEASVPSDSTEFEALLNQARAYFGDRLESITLVSHLVEAPAVLLEKKTPLSKQLEQMLALSGQAIPGGIGRDSLGLNPAHGFIRSLARRARAGLSDGDKPDGDGPGGTDSESESSSSGAAPSAPALEEGLEILYGLARMQAGQELDKAELFSTKIQALLERHYAV